MKLSSIQLFPLLLSLISFTSAINIPRNNNGVSKSTSSTSHSPSPTVTVSSSADSSASADFSPIPSAATISTTFSIAPEATNLPELGTIVDPKEAATVSAPQAAGPVTSATDNSPVETSVYFTLGDGTSQVPDPTSFALAAPAATTAASGSSQEEIGVTPLDKKGTELDAVDIGVAPANTTTGSGSGGLGLTTSTTDYNARRQDPTKNPAIYDDGDCVYKYKHVLGSVKTAKLGDVFSQPGFELDLKDIDQGKVGDCQLGSAVLAMIAQGHYPYLRGMTRHINTAAGDHNVAFVFRQKALTRNVFVDDQLPAVLKPKDPKTRCGSYLGFQPVPGVNAKASATAVQSRSYFMPLLEKAWAKYLDAYPKFKSSSAKGKLGYGGLEGANGTIALAAFTGGDTRYTAHGNGDNAARVKMIAHLKACLTTKQPCVIGFPKVSALEKGTYGGKFDGKKSYFLTTVTIGTNKKQVNVGKVEKIILNDKTGKVFDEQFRVIDYDNPLNGAGRDVRIIGLHAYAIDPLGGSTWNEDLRKCRVKLINPWGHHAYNCKNEKTECSKNDATACETAREGCTGPAAFELSCSVAVKLFSSIGSAVNRLAPLEL